MKLRTLITATIACALPMAALAAPQTRVWTSPCSTGSVDEGSQGSYAFTNSTFGYATSSTTLQTLFERVNVSNTSDIGLNPDQPGWTTLELGYVDNNGQQQVSATLYQVTPATGLITAIATATSVDSATPGIVTTPILATMDFSNFLYYVSIGVSRNTSIASPKCNTIRIY